MDGKKEVIPTPRVVESVRVPMGLMDPHGFEYSLDSSLDLG